MSEGEPLITVIRSAHLRKTPSVAARHTEESLPRDDGPSPPADMIGDFADGDADLSNGQEMIAAAINTLEKTNDVSCLFT